MAHESEFIDEENLEEVVELEVLGHRVTLSPAA